MEPTEEELNKAVEILLTTSNIHQKIINFILSTNLSLENISLLLQKHPKIITHVLAQKNINDILTKDILKKLKTLANPTTISNILYNKNIDEEKKKLLLKNNFVWLREIAYSNSRAFNFYINRNNPLDLTKINHKCSPEIVKEINELIEPCKNKIKSHNFIIEFSKNNLTYSWHCDKCKMHLKINNNKISIFDVIVYLGRRSKILSCDQMVIKNIII